MNVYRYSFCCQCPVDGDLVSYDLKIRAPHMVKAEDIRAICEVSPSFQEDLANRLAPLGGRQVLRATHRGVSIKTVRP
jgi:hypothetical protein